MSKKFSVAVLGATGLVGEAMLSILEQRKFPLAELYPLASERSAGKTLRCQGREFAVTDVPSPQRDELVSQLVDWYGKDSSSAIHGATGWLLRSQVQFAF